jgi:ketosteroid isomerase-like protein
MSPTRRLVLAAAGEPFVAVAAAAATLGPAPSPGADVSEFVERALRAHEALMRGDIEGYRNEFTLADDFTLMSPFGGEPSRGGRLSAEQWAAIGRFFRDGRDASVELVQAYRSPGMVVLALIERSHVAVGVTPAQPWALRVTLVFRQDDGRWVLVHRHADPLVHGIEVPRAAALARSDR